MRKKSHSRRPTQNNYEVESNKTLATLCNLSVAQVSDFREIFRQIDLDNNGCIDEAELGQLLQSIHSDEHLCSEEYIRELITKVKATQVKEEVERDSLEFTFEELMLSILKRPNVDYTKDDVLEAFAVLSGTQGKGGVINNEKLARAIRYGAGGIARHDAEEIMTMLEHTPTATFDYVELCDLLMGQTRVTLNAENERAMMEKCRVSIKAASEQAGRRNSHANSAKKARKQSSSKIQHKKSKHQLKTAKLKQHPHILFAQASFNINDHEDEKSAGKSESKKNKNKNKNGHLPSVQFASV